MNQLAYTLVLIQMVLGWSVMSKLSDSMNLDSSLLVFFLHINDVKINDLWNLDSLGEIESSEKQSKREVQELALKHFEKTVIIESNYRYKVCFPWIDSHADIPNNRELSQKRLKNTVKNLKSTGNLKAHEQVFNEWEDEGVIESVTAEPNYTETSNIHFLPHLPVRKQNSTKQLHPFLTA